MLLHRTVQETVQEPSKCRVMMWALDRRWAEGCEGFLFFFWQGDLCNIRTLIPEPRVRLIWLDSVSMVTPSCESAPFQSPQWRWSLREAACARACPHACYCIYFLMTRTPADGCFRPVTVVVFYTYWKFMLTLKYLYIFLGSVPVSGEK